MTNKAEVKIYRFVKLVPIFVILISFFSIYVLYKNNQTLFNQEVDRLTKRVLLDKENLMKSEVLRVYDFIEEKKSLTTEKMQADLKERVNGAYTIASSIYNNNRDKSNQEIKKLITDTLRDIRFNGGRGYFFIFESKGMNVLQPIFPQLEGTNLWDFKDIKGHYIVRKMSEITTKQGEGFMTWWWQKPSAPEIKLEKIGYGKHFAPFDWYIGTGDFIVDYEEQLKKELLVSINKIRYGKEGYIFIIDHKGTLLSHVKKSYIGTNRIHYKDENGLFVTRALLSIGRAGQGFLSYMASVTPSADGAARKRSFVIGFDDWQWVIGSGAYLDDIASIVAHETAKLQEKNSKELTQNIIFAILLSFSLLILSLFFTKILKMRFLQYQDKVHKKNIALYNLNLNLERLVFTRTTALGAVNLDLKATLTHLKRTQNELIESKKMSSMVGLVTGMAHELNTPLGIMVTSISQIEKEITSLFDKVKSQQLTRKELIKIEESWSLGSHLVESNLQRSIHLVKNFKLLSSSYGADNLECFSIRLLLKSLMDLFSKPFKELGVTLTIDLEEDITLTCYQWVLNGVLDQLIKNSLTHGFEGTSSPCIHIAAQQVDDDIEITYSDNGCGSENIEKIFEPFYTTKRGSDCTGLGLPIIYNQVIHKLSGTITCAIDDKQGLVFVINIPIDLTPTP